MKDTAKKPILVIMAAGMGSRFGVLSGKPCLGALHGHLLHDEAIS